MLSRNMHAPSSSTLHRRSPRLLLRLRLVDRLLRLQLMDKRRGALSRTPLLTPLSAAQLECRPVPVQLDPWLLRRVARGWPLVQGDRRPLLHQRQVQS